jgi:hypothetical protein
VFRTAHVALDADERQVGEANVWPPRLRLECPTEWRVCQYPGSRYRDKAPMNVTALKAMIKHWKPIMAVILAVRGELQARLGLPQAPWTIGDLHVLSCVVLGLPAFQLMKRGGTSPQPPLHPVLSSLFRITDGVRMTTEDLMFRVEDPHRADKPITAAELYARAEQRGLLIGATGVCAGPRHMMDEFLATVADGVPPEGIAELALPAEVAELLSELPAAIEYGLHGIGVWGVSLPVWIAMSRAYQELLAMLEPARPFAEGDIRARLCARLRAEWAVLEKVQITVDHDRDVHLDGYVNGYERSWRASHAPVGQPTHAREIAPSPETAMHREAAGQLRRILGARLARGEADPGGRAPSIDRIVDVLLRYLRAEQAILATTAAHLEAINALLDRPRPNRPLQVLDLRVYYRLGGDVTSFPYLFDTLDDELGVRVECTTGAIHVIDRRPG